MNRHTIALALFALSAPISAASAASYSAVPASPSADARIIGRDIVWRCGPDSCAGATESSRPVVLCQGLAKKAGPIVKFVADGRTLSEGELAACNASAKPAKDAGAAALARAN